MKYKIYQHFERLLRQCLDNHDIRGINNEIKTLEAKLVETERNLTEPDFTIFVNETSIHTRRSVIGKVPYSKLSNLITRLEKAGEAIEIMADPTVFKHLVQYLESDRTLLPEGNSQMRVLVEKEIKFWGLDRGLARVDTLTAQVAKDMQQILNTIPNIESGSEVYRKHQFVSISWLAAQSGRLLNLVEGEHVIMR